MNDKTMYLIGLIVIVGLVSCFLRAFPFLIFGAGKKTPPPVIHYIGRVLAPAIIAMLVVYCFGAYLRNGAISAPLYGFAELAASVVTIGLQIWKRNPLLSIFTGTALYMCLV